MFNYSPDCRGNPFHELFSEQKDCIEKREGFCKVTKHDCSLFLQQKKSTSFATDAFKYD